MANVSLVLYRPRALAVVKHKSAEERWIALVRAMLTFMQYLEDLSEVARAMNEASAASEKIGLQMREIDGTEEV